MVWKFIIIKYQTCPNLKVKFLLNVIFFFNLRNEYFIFMHLAQNIDGQYTIYVTKIQVLKSP